MINTLISPVFTETFLTVEVCEKGMCFQKLPVTNSVKTAPEQWLVWDIDHQIDTGLGFLRFFAVLSIIQRDLECS